MTSWTALMSAATNSDTSVAEILIEAKANVNAKNNNGKSVLMCAKDASNPKGIGLLRNAGAK